MMNSLYKCMDINKDEEDYIVDINNPNQNIFVFRGVKKITELFFDKIFGKELWNNSVIKFINEEKK